MENKFKIDFFLIGFAKSGTTSMYEYLKGHPEIYIPYIKDTSYFGKDIYPYLTRQEFENLYKNVKGRIMGECMALYLYSKTAAKQIYQHNPDAKIVIMLRNPVDMLFSFHSQMVYAGVETEKDFSKALKLENYRKNEYKKYKKDFWGRTFLYYSDFMKLSDQVERFTKLFNRKNIHVIIFDDFISNTEIEYKKLLKFIGVKNVNFKLNFQKFNPNKTVYNNWIQKFMANPPKVIKTISHYLVPLKIRYSIIRIIMILNTKAEERHEMNPNLRKKLKKRYLIEIKKLEKLLQINLKTW